ncbi:hypothetical protein NL108_018713 [Boleophthalmus pectinirostris]|nr:hypothetical protein NL108_018713 [Boleophthalmus pectinirostris]
MAPEILRSLAYNPVVTDVWSMGVILFKMLYDAFPFSSTRALKMAHVKMTRHINFPDTPHVSLEAVELIQSMLHPNAAHRTSIPRILESPWMMQDERVEGAAESSEAKGGEKTGEDNKDSDEAM